MEEFKKPKTPKARKNDESTLMELDAFLEAENQLNFADIDNLQRIMSEQIRTIKKFDRDRKRADKLDKQIQALEKEKTEDVGEIPKQESFDLASCTKEKDKVPKETKQMSQERKFEASCSKDLPSCSWEESDVSSKNTTHVQVAPNLYQDTEQRDLRSNVATQNVNPHKFYNPYYGHGLHHLVRNPFSFGISRPQLRFEPPPANRQPQIFPQHPFTSPQIPPMTFMSPQTLLQEHWRKQIASLPRMSPQVLLQEHWRAQTGSLPRISPQALMQEIWRARLASLPRISPQALLQELWRAQLASLPRMSPPTLLQEVWRAQTTLPRMPPRFFFPHLPTPPLAHSTSFNSDFPSSAFTAKPKKSALRRHNVKRNQRREVHFSQSVIEKDEMKKKIARSKQQASNEKDGNNLMDTVAKLRFTENEMEEENTIEFKLKSSEANSDN